MGHLTILTPNDVTTSGRTFTLSNNYRGVLWIFDSNNARCGAYFLFSTGSGVVATAEIKSATNITIDTNTANKITLTPTTGSRVIMIMTVAGSIS